MIEITRRSPLSGQLTTLTIPMTADEYAVAFLRYATGTPLWDAFFLLPTHLREFINSGVTPDEWEAGWR
jgi:hypothetical protein